MARGCSARQHPIELSATTGKLYFARGPAFGRSSSAAGGIFFARVRDRQMDLDCVDVSFWQRYLPVSTGEAVSAPKSGQVAIVGAGVSGLTCGVFFAERGFRTAIFAEQIGQQTTSGAAGALWFPYDAEPADKVIPWALATYKVLVDLVKDK